MRSGRSPSSKARAIQLAVDLAKQPRLAVRGMLAALHDAEHKTVDELLVAERAAVTQPWEHPTPPRG